MAKYVGIGCWEDSKEGKNFFETNNNFAKMVEEQEAVPLMLPVVDDRDTIDGFIDSIDGLLLTGGSDVSPYLFGEGPKRYLSNTSPKRDRAEMYLLQRALEKRIPILAVCRGMQLLNVYLGGSLYQDIYSQLEDCDNHSDRDNMGVIYYHEVTMEPNSLLETILGEKTVVNSFHHQAIKKLGEDLRATAYSRDGIIEGIEYTKDERVFGIQFHPEFPQHNHKFKEIFKSFVDSI